MKFEALSSLFWSYWQKSCAGMFLPPASIAKNESHRPLPCNLGVLPDWRVSTPAVPVIYSSHAGMHNFFQLRPSVPRWGLFQTWEPVIDCDGWSYPEKNSMGEALPQLCWVLVPMEWWLLLPEATILPQSVRGVPGEMCSTWPSTGGDSIALVKQL